MPTPSLRGHAPPFPAPDHERSEGWTFTTLLEHLNAVIVSNDARYEQRFTSQEKAVKDALDAQKTQTNAALVSSEKAVDKAEFNAEKWRENANEWRAAMNDREARFMGRDEATQFFKALTDKVDALATRIDKSEGQGHGLATSWSVLVSASSLLLALAAIIVTFLRR